MNLGFAFISVELLNEHFVCFLDFWSSFQRLLACNSAHGTHAVVSLPVIPGMICFEVVFFF